MLYLRQDGDSAFVADFELTVGGSGHLQLNTCRRSGEGNFLAIEEDSCDRCSAREGNSK